MAWKTKIIALAAGSMALGFAGCANDSGSEQRVVPQAVETNETTAGDSLKHADQAPESFVSPDDDGTRTIAIGSIIVEKSLPSEIAAPLRQIDSTLNDIPAYFPTPSPVQLATMRDQVARLLTASETGTTLTQEQKRLVAVFDNAVLQKLESALQSGDPDQMHEAQELVSSRLNSLVEGTR